ncbi:MAG: adenylate/guanylate cyclase domain-containing protein [Paracoccaceae bacterium]
MAAIVATDVVGFSGLTERDEAGTIANLRSLREDVVLRLVGRHQGRLVKLMGDGMLAEFVSVVEAVGFAVALQRETAAHQAGLPVERRLVLRVGVNLGDVIVEGDDLLGDGVNVAARLEQMAEPGGICLSGTVYDHLAGKVGVGFEFIGESRVKNIARPVRTYRVLLDGTPMTSPARTRRRGAAGIALVAALAAALAVGAWQVWRGGGAAVDPHSIVVLPFGNLSGDPDDMWIAEGVVEDLITELARNGELTVIARSSSANLPEGERTPDAAARRLKVRYVLGGSVRRLSGDSLRLTVRLIDGPRNATIWNEQYDLAAEGFVRTQDEIVDRIAATLLSEVRSTEKAESLRTAPTSFDAFELAARGLALKDRFTPEAFREGRELLRRAIGIDPGYAPAYAYLGLLDAVDAASGFTGTRSLADIDAAIATARKATELDPAFARGWQALGHALCLKGDCAEGLRALDRAVELGPSEADNQLYRSHALASNGRFAEAVTAGERAIKLNPLTPLYYSGFLARSLFGAGEYERAIATTQPCVDAQFYQRSCRLARIAALAELGREDEARGLMADFLAHAPGFTRANAERAVGFPGSAEATARLLGALERAGLRGG